jgi:uncharacterized protein YcfL
MKLHLFFLAALLGSLFLFSSCASRGAYPPLDTRQHNLEEHASFVLLDRRAQRSVTSPSIQEKFHPDGRLEVVANIRNRESRRIQVQVNCEFKDEQGFVVDSTPFQTLILREHEQRSVRFISMNDRAKRYTIRVAEAR